MNIRVWHCYHYGPFGTYVMLAESEEALKAKIWAEIRAGWYSEDDGPLPENFEEAMELYENTIDPYGCYFGDIGWAVIDASACEADTVNGEAA